MSRKWRRVILGGGLGIYLVGMGFLGGTLVERIRFDHRRTAVLNRYDELVRQWHTYLIQREQKALAVPETADAPWTATGCALREQRTTQFLADAGP